jgi:hypothetical protein
MYLHQFRQEGRWPLPGEQPETTAQEAEERDGEHRPGGPS